MVASKANPRSDYEKALDVESGAREALAEYALTEAQYRRAMLHGYRTAGRADLAERYGRLSGFAFGSLDPAADLQFIGSEVERGARRAALTAPPLYVGPWPGHSLNASAMKSQSGFVIRVKVGTPSVLRAAALLVTLGIGEATGDPSWGTDHHDRAWIKAEFQRILLSSLAAKDVRLVSPVLCLGEPRESLRRGLLLAGLTYLLAHEYGHVIAGHLGRSSQSFALNARRLFEPRSEGDVLWAQKKELEADARACTILAALRDEARGPARRQDRPDVTTMGAALVFAVLAGLFWMSLAAGSENYGGTHPPSEVRIAGLLDMAARDSTAGTGAEALLRWLWDVLGIEANMATFGGRRL